MRLQKLQPGSFHVQVRRQYCGRPTALEQATLQLSSQARVWVREVALHAAGAECVLARTVVPLTALQGRLRCLQQLGNRSLGSFLFRQPSLVRHPIQVSQCASDSPLAWCRYSVFGLYGERVLVSEGFHATMVNTEMTHN